jgi:hypothetical protein
MVTGWIRPNICPPLIPAEAESRVLALGPRFRRDKRSPINHKEIAETAAAQAQLRFFANLYVRNHAPAVLGRVCNGRIYLNKSKCFDIALVI